MSGGKVPAAEIRGMIEQVYKMASWHSGDQVDYPPAAHGRCQPYRGVTGRGVTRRAPSGRSAASNSGAGANVKSVATVRRPRWDDPGRVPPAAPLRCRTG